MGALPAGKETGAGLSDQRHRPEHMLLYEIVEQHDPDLAWRLSRSRRRFRTLPG